MDMLIQLIQQYGPLAGAVVFFVWRDWKREDRLSSRINELEDEQRQVILPLVEKCTQVVAKNTEVMAQNTEVMRRLDWWLERTVADAKQPKS